MASQCGTCNRSASVGLRSAAGPASFRVHALISHRVLTRSASRPIRQLRVHAGPLVKDVTHASFNEEVLQSSVPVLVDFWATWCGPCKLVAPSMDWAAKEYSGALKVVKVDADPNPQLVDSYKVQGLPTLIIFKDGKKVEGSHWEGAITRKQLTEYLEKHKIVPMVNA